MPHMPPLLPDDAPDEPGFRIPTKHAFARVKRDLLIFLPFSMTYLLS